MHSILTIDLARDCEVVRIPQGTPVTLPKGTTVDVTQQLGGSYTLHAQGGLFRLDGKDADALDLETSPADAKPSSDKAQNLDETLIWDTLRTCYDPEIPVNIVDLGLVYDLQLQKLPSGKFGVDVKMTLTAPGCGMGSVIAGDAQQKLLFLDGVGEARVEIVWDPPWHQSRITPEGRRILGLE
jgi:probable FeS assembly SUF system protein SufT